MSASSIPKPANWSQSTIIPGAASGATSRCDCPRRSLAVATPPLGIVEHRRADPRRDRAIRERRPDRPAVAGAAVLDQGQRKAVADPRVQIARRDVTDHTGMGSWYDRRGFSEHVD